MFKRVLQTLHMAPRETAGKKAEVNARKLALSMEISPQPLKLSEARQMKIAISLTNRSGKYVHLEFPTTQRIELLVRDRAEKLLTQWSEDQSFANEPAYVTINPGERIEYNATLATRDLSAGQEYLVEGFFPNFTDLRIQKTIQPEK